MGESAVARAEQPLGHCLQDVCLEANPFGASLEAGGRRSNGPGKLARLGLVLAQAMVVYVVKRRREGGWGTILQALNEPKKMLC